jgi:Bacterial protein of unknown function (DUF937)/PRC-barrel domain
MNDLVSTISSLLTPEVVGRLATASGLDNAVAQSAVSAAVPSILSGLAGIAATPAGGRQLASAVAQQPTDILGSILSGFTGSAPKAETGTGLLSSLLGGGALGLLTSAVAKFIGIGEGPTRNLIGLLAPLIIGVLGREQRAAGLDGNGLARMLTEQKEQIAAAMPFGLSRLLDTGGFYKSIRSTASTESRDAPRPIYATHVQRTVGDTRTRAQGVTWPYWMLPLLAFGALFWYLLPSGSQVTEPVATSPTKSIYLASVPDSWVSIGQRPNDYVNQDIYDLAGQKLGTISDVLLGPEGKAAAAIINTEQSLGIGHKDVAVPVSALQLEERDNRRRILIDTTKEALRAAPAFQRRQAPKQ